MDALFHRRLSQVAVLQSFAALVLFAAPPAYVATARALAPPTQRVPPTVAPLLLLVADHRDLEPRTQGVRMGQRANSTGCGRPSGRPL